MNEPVSSSTTPSQLVNHRPKQEISPGKRIAMKVRSLIKKLVTVDPDREVIIQKDSEGNSFSPLVTYGKAYTDRRLHGAGRLASTHSRNTMKERSFCDPQTEELDHSGPRGPHVEPGRRMMLPIRPCSATPQPKSISNVPVFSFHRLPGLTGYLLQFDFEVEPAMFAIDHEISLHRNTETFCPTRHFLIKDGNAMTTYDFDGYDPIAEADTGIAKEWTDAEVRAMLDEDEERIKALRQHKQIFILMHKVLDEIEREHAEESGAATSILREKILRGVGLSDSELESIVFSETCHLIFQKLTTREFLRRMILVAQLVDLDEE